MHKPLETVIAESLGCDPSLINDRTSPENLPQWDSAAMLNIIVGVEQAYQIRLAQEDLLRFDSVAGIREVLGRHLGQR